MIAAIGGWCLAGGLELALWCDLRIAPEARSSAIRSGAGGAADRRRHAAAAEDRRARAGAGPDPDRTDDRNRRSAGLGSLTEVVGTGGTSSRPRDRCGPRRFPQRTMLSDRRSAIEGRPPAREGPRVRGAARPEGRSGGQAPRGGRAGVWPDGRGPRAEPTRARPLARPAHPGLRSELPHKPFLRLTFDGGDHLDLGPPTGCRGLSWRAGRRPGRSRRSCSSGSRRGSAGRCRRSMLTSSIAAAEIAWMPRSPRSTGSRERPWAMSRASATRTTPASSV